MSRRREASDLQKALRLSTQGSIPHSSNILTSSSPIQIPSGFRLAFQSESTQDSTILHPSSHSGSGGTGAPSTFQGFQGGIFAGLQTPVIGSDRSVGALSPTMITTAAAHASITHGQNTNPVPLRDVPRSKPDEDEEIVPGSEDEETEEEQPFEAIRRSAETRFPSVPASKPMTPMPIPPSETIGSFPTPSGSRHPQEIIGQAMRDISSPIDGFTASNSNGTDRKKGSSPSDHPGDTSASSIVLSKPTEIVRSRPVPKQRKRADGDMQDRTNLNSSAESSVPGKAQSSGPEPVMDDGTAPAANSVGGVSGSRARSITPPLKSKTTVVYTKRSINSKKRKILLSDSESEEDEVVPPTLDQRVLSTSALIIPAKAPKSFPEQKLDELERPSKKNRTVQDSARHERDSSVDPLDLEYVDPLRTPLKNQVVVEIDSVAKPKNTSADDEHNDNDIVVVLPSASKSKSKAKAKGKRAQYDDDDDEDPFEGLPLDTAMADSDEEDDFVPSGRKSKAAAKKKKAPPKKKEKVAKGKKAASTATPVEATPALSIGSEVMDVDILPDKDPAPGEIETTQTPPARKGAQSTKTTKGKATTSTQSTSKSSTVPQKSAEFIDSGDDEDEVLLAAPPSSTKGKGKAGTEAVVSKGEGTKDNSKVKTKAKIVGSDDEDEIHSEEPASRSTVDEATGPVIGGSVLQEASESQLNVPMKDEQVKSKTPNFVVSKGGKIVEFRTSRDDLPKVVSNTGGVKRMGMSRAFRIPSLHRNLKAPPKRLAAPPKKPERKKKSDDEYSDEEPVDEFGRPKPKPGSKEWYMMED